MDWRIIAVFTPIVLAISWAVFNIGRAALGQLQLAIKNFKKNQSWIVFLASPSLSWHFIRWNFDVDIWAFSMMSSSVWIFFNVGRKSFNMFFLLLIGRVCFLVCIPLELWFIDLAPSSCLCCLREVVDEVATFYLWFFGVLLNSSSPLLHCVGEEVNGY